jgi:hypothetical protein
MKRLARRIRQSDPVLSMDQGLPGISQIDEQTRQNCSSLVEKVADVVLAYRPKSKQPKPRKRKKAKR